MFQSFFLLNFVCYCIFVLQLSVLCVCILLYFCGYLLPMRWTKISILLMVYLFCVDVYIGHVKVFVSVVDNIFTHISQQLIL